MENGIAQRIELCIKAILDRLPLSCFPLRQRWEDLAPVQTARLEPVRRVRENNEVQELE